MVFSFAFKTALKSILQINLYGNTKMCIQVLGCVYCMGASSFCRGYRMVPPGKTYIAQWSLNHYHFGIFVQTDETEGNSWVKGHETLAHAVFSICFDIYCTSSLSSPWNMQEPFLKLANVNLWQDSINGWNGLRKFWHSMDI